MCALLQCGPVFDRNGLITGGYLYNWLQLVLNSPKEKVSLVTRCHFSVIVANFMSQSVMIHLFLSDSSVGSFHSRSSP